MTPPSSQPVQFPLWVRVIAILFLLIWFPAYWHGYGLANFLHFCNLAVILTCLGFAFQNRLLLSTQALACPLICLIWTIDVASRFFLGRYFIGGTEYMFDPANPLHLRLFSLYHIALPILLIWAVSLVGYDRRAWRTQSAIALPVLIVSRFGKPTENCNYAFADPFLHHQWGPPAVHISVIYVLLIFVVYWPVDWLLRRYFSPSASTLRNAPASEL